MPRTVPGNSIDLTQRENLQAQAPQTWQRIEQGQPLGLADVEALAKAGVSDDVIVSQLHISRAIYHLTTAEILELKGAGVDESVIDFMINTPNSAGGSAPATTAPPAPPPPLAEEVVVAPNPTYVWVDGVWDWNGVTWVWVRGHWCPPPWRNAHWVAGVWVPRRGVWVWRRGCWR